MRRYFVLVVVGVLLMGVMPVAAQGPATDDTQWQAKVAPQLLDVAMKGGTTEIIVVLTEQADLSGADKFMTRADKAAYVYKQLRAVAERTQPKLVETAKGEAVEIRRFGIVNALLIKGDANLIEKMAKRADVARVEANPEVKGSLGMPDAPAQQSVTPWNIDTIKAPQVWAQGYRGAGVVVGSSDTGVEWTHSALKSQYRGWNGSTANHNYNWYDPVANSPTPIDDNDHGTHTVGTMLGDASGHKIGVAPDAKWIACRNMNAGVGTPALYMACTEFMLAPFPLGGSFIQNGDPSRGVDISNNSWSCPVEEGCSWQTLKQMVENIRAAGIVFVVAAGNNGPQYGAGCHTLNEPPAIYAASFSVGAMDPFMGLAYFSSRGSVDVDGSNRPKPDVTAPGSGIESSVRGNNYRGMAGTSMAAPHVVGIMALMLSANPALNGQVAQLETLTRTSSIKKDDPSCGYYANGRANNMWGYGLVDAVAAVAAARNVSGGTPTPTPTPTPPPAFAQNPTTTGVFRPSNGHLYLKNANTSGYADIELDYGLPGDKPVTGDWNGDGIDTIGIYRNGVFYLRNSNTTGQSDLVVPFGQNGDIPIIGDWNGDGVDTIGIYRSGWFYLRNSNTTGAPDLSFNLGIAGDVPIAGDWTNKGYDCVGVFRPSNGHLYLKNYNTTGYADIELDYGIPNDKPIAGDWDGNGTDTVGVYRNGVFYLRNSNTNGIADVAFALGVQGDEPIVGDWNGLP